MGDVFGVVPAAMDAFAMANHAVAEVISEAGSVDSEGMLAAAAAAVGPLGAGFLAAYAPAQAANLAATQQVALVHAAIGGATEATKVASVAVDDV